jgi:DNA-binding CsgD family transcriptional regulator
VNWNIDLLDKIFLELKEASVNFDRMDQSDLKKTMKICNQQDVIMWIQDFEHLVPYFINDTGKKYYGFETNLFGTSGFEVYTKIAHPDDLGAISQLVAFLTDYPHSTCKTVCRVRHHSGEYRWLYALDRALSFTETGKAKYLISISYDVEGEIQNNSINIVNQNNIKQKRSRYLSLTPREKEILRLIGQEKTSQEIALHLFIEPSTVSTHRKHMMKKLHVKNALGLMEYALLFSDSSL